MTASISIPARITTVDYLGVSTAASEHFRGRALAELLILQNHMKFNKLKQYRRTVDLEKGVRLECSILWGVGNAVIVIGADSERTVDEYACFCTSYGVLAGRILELKDEFTPENDTPVELTDHYVDDTSYAADIIVCQKAGSGRPKIIETRDISTAVGVTKEQLMTKEINSFWISTVIYNVPFTDHFMHQPGELVLVLVMPLVDFRPTIPGVFPYGMEYEEKHGSWSPEVNRRTIVGSIYEDPDAQITSLYLASTGMTNLITLDSDIWDEEAGGNIKYCPFRILPIPLDSCLSGYSS